MFGYIITHKNEKRVVISIRDNVLHAIWQFLYDVYDYNNNEVQKDFEFSIKDKTWTWRNTHGTFESIGVITT